MPDGVRGSRSARVELARRRVAGEGSRGERAQLLERRGVRRIGGDDPDGDALAPFGIEPAAGGHVADTGVLAERRLDLVGPDLLPAGVDQVVEPTHDVEAALAVDLARVAGPQPAVLGEGRRAGLGSNRYPRISVGPASSMPPSGSIDPHPRCRERTPS